MLSAEASTAVKDAQQRAARAGLSLTAVDAKASPRPLELNSSTGFCPNWPIDLNRNLLFDVLSENGYAILFPRHQLIVFR